MAKKKVTAKKTNKKTRKNATKEKIMGPSVAVYNLEGKVVGRQPLSKRIFAAKINPVLEALAVRVYQANRRQGTVSTKTRGEVTGSTRKLYRQKGTGKSRQGSIRAPHRVGGGVVFGPKPKDSSLKLPKKAKRAALFSALSVRFREGKVLAISDFTKLAPKTKAAVSVLEKLPITGKKLLILETKQDNVLRATANLPGVNCLTVGNLSTYNLLENDAIIFSVGALQVLENIYQKRESNAAN